MKWSNMEFTQTTIAGVTVNQPRRPMERASSARNRLTQIGASFKSLLSFFTSEPGRKTHVLTVAEWQRREQLAIGLQLAKAFAGAMFIFFMIYVFLIALVLITPEVG